MYYRRVTGCQLGSRWIRSATFARKVDLSCRNTKYPKAGKYVGSDYPRDSNPTDLIMDELVLMVDGPGKRESLMQCQLGPGQPQKVSLLC